MSSGSWKLNMNLNLNLLGHFVCTPVNLHPPPHSWIVDTPHRRNFAQMFSTRKSRMTELSYAQDSIDHFKPFRYVIPELDNRWTDRLQTDWRADRIVISVGPSRVSIPCWLLTRNRHGYSKVTMAGHVVNRFYRLAPFLMTLNDPWPIFKGHADIRCCISQHKE